MEEHTKKKLLKSGAVLAKGSSSILTAAVSILGVAGSTISKGLKDLGIIWTQKSRTRQKPDLSKKKTKLTDRIHLVYNFGATLKAKY